MRVLECQGFLRLETASNIFQNVSKYFGYLTVDLFASRLYQQLLQYITWKPDLSSIAVGAMQQFWNQIFPCMLSPFQSNKSDPKKSSSGQGETNDNSYTKIENTTLASSFFRNVSTKTTTNETSVRPTVISSRQKTSFGLKWKSNVNGVESY